MDPINEPQQSDDFDASWEERQPDIKQKITIEEFQPKGTLLLTFLYFLIVALMFAFMYYAEFANHGPSIIN